jgi:DUF4097 and DUF4098 domain-containing protein YvlB
MSRRRVVAFGVLVGLTIVTTGCDAGLTNRFSDSRVEESTITEVRIKGGSGSVVLDRSVEKVMIERTVHYGETKPTQRYDSTASGVLTLNTSCPSIPQCSIDYVVHVPASVKVSGRLDSGSIELKNIGAATVNTSSGKIAITNATGGVNATTDSGSLNVTNVDGRLNGHTASGSIHVVDAGNLVNLETYSGSITASALAGSSTTAKTESGSLTLSLTNPQDITATTSSGSVTVTVPVNTTYRVDWADDDDEPEIGIKTDHSAKNLITVRTESGSIKLREASA